MATASIPVDLFNPGQVFACLGLMELAAKLCEETITAGFDWSESADVKFTLRVEGGTNPIAVGLDFLTESDVVALTPHDSEHDTEKWDVHTRRCAAGAPFPIPPPPKPASLPAELQAKGQRVSIHVRGDIRSNAAGTGRDNVKFWGGSGGKPGACFVAEALELWRRHDESDRLDPLNFSAPQGGSLRFDWRRDYIPIDAGFSLNEHKAWMRSCGYPLVEVLAAIGLSNARPHRPDGRDKLRYRYGVAGRADQKLPLRRALLPPAYLRAALGTAELPFPTRSFTMHLDWPGKENQARCITTVTEDSEP